MQVLEDYKNEIVDKIDDLIESNENLKDVIEDEKTSDFRQDTDDKNTDNETKQAKEESNNEETNDVLSTEDFQTEHDEETFEEIIIKQNDDLINHLENTQKLISEASWTIVISLVVALGMHYFINQFSKW